VKSNPNFSQVNGIVELEEKMVRTQKRNGASPSLLALEVSIDSTVATATVERVFFQL